MQAEFEGSKFIYIAITNDLYIYVKEPSIYAFFSRICSATLKISLLLLIFNCQIAPYGFYSCIYLLLNEILIWQKVNHSVKKYEIEI